MPHYVYDTEGRFIYSFTCSEALLETNIAALQEGWGAVTYVDYIDTETQYHDLGNTVRPRPTISAEPDKLTVQVGSEDMVTISGLPIPCTINVGTQEYRLTDPDDNTFEFTIPATGTYSVTVEQFPYIPKTWEVLAV